MDKVLVLAERRGSAAALLTLARRLGTPIAVTLAATHVDPLNARPHCPHPLNLDAVNAASVDVDAVDAVDTVDTVTLARFGAQAIWTIQSPEAETHPATVRVEALTRLAALTKPCCILIAEGPDGHDSQEIAGRIAVRLDSGVLTGAVELWMGPNGPVVTQRVLEGSYRAESEVSRGVTICTVRTCEVEATPHPAQPTVRSLKLALPQGLRAARLTSSEPHPTDDLASAAIIVAGGHGLGSRDGFALAERVAQALNGAVAGSRTAAELGWCPSQRMVDQIGTTVHPRLYLALGVSGSIRHRAGMQGAQTIVAVDRDPEAPILGVADLAVVGDARDVAKELLTEIDKRRHK